MNSREIQQLTWKIFWKRIRWLLIVALSVLIVATAIISLSLLLGKGAFLIITLSIIASYGIFMTWHLSNIDAKNAVKYSVTHKYAR